MRKIKLSLLTVILCSAFFGLNSCKKNNPHDEVPAKKVTVVPPPPPATTLETQLYGDWICDGDTVWATTPYHDNMYLNYHLNLTSTAYPSNSNFVTYFEEGLYGPMQTPSTTSTWKEVDGSPTYSHHVLAVFFPSTVIMQVTAHTLVLAQTDHPGNMRTFYFHK